MLDIKKIIENKEFFSIGLSNRGYDISNLDTIIDFDSKRREYIKKGDQKRSERNEISKKIGLEKRKPTDIETTYIKKLSEDLKSLDKNLSIINKKIKEIMLEIPNLPNEQVPIGTDESSNVEKDTRGYQRNEEFIKPHWDIGPEKDILDLEAGANISGSRFFVLKGKGAKLHRALMNWMMDVHTNEFGYTEIDPPYLVKKETMIGSGNLPKFKDNLYRDDETDLWLIPTAEVSLNGLHQGKIIPPNTLPLSYVAMTPSFRKEHASAGRDIRGIKRVHQFYKVEMFRFVPPETSMDYLEKMIKNARALCERLELSSKLIQLSTGDIGFQSSITFDIEVWAPGSKEWLEVSSISNCMDFQTRRNNTRYKENQASSTTFPHTLNGSGLALPRIWVAILENGQQEDGTIKIPEVLVPYTGFKTI